MIDISALRELYSSGQITNIGHVSAEYNLAEPLKKTKAAMLEKLLSTGKVNYSVDLWIVHEENPLKTARQTFSDTKYNC